MVNWLYHYTIRDITLIQYWIAWTIEKNLTQRTEIDEVHRKFREGNEFDISVVGKKSEKIIFCFGRLE